MNVKTEMVRLAAVAVAAAAVASGRDDELGTDAVGDGDDNVLPATRDALEFQCMKKKKRKPPPLIYSPLHMVWTI